MEAKEKFLELKKAWINAKGHSGLRAEIDSEMDAFFNSLTDAQREEVIRAADAEFGRIRTEITDINDTLNVRDLLAGILPMVSVSHLSKKYFDKSASWFYQRMNGNLVHGKPAKFTPDELITLRRVLDELSEKFSQTSKLLAV
jgi:hypothetical protein